MKKVEIITRLKGIAETRLEKRVLNDILKQTENYNAETFKERLEQVLRDYSYGCSTGVVTSLISYKQTNRFFDTYRTEILELLQYDLIEGMFDIHEDYNEYDWEPKYYITFNNSDIKIKVDYNYKLNGKKYDMYQKNILAWYAFEACVYKFMNEMEL